MMKKLFAVVYLLFFAAGCGHLSDNYGQPELGRTSSVTFCVHNLMTYDIYIEVSSVCNHDWQSQNRPERLERAYKAGESYYHQMDMNMWDKTHPATFTFYRATASGAKTGNPIDQWRMHDMGSISGPYIESMNSGYKGKIQIVSSKGGSGVHMTIVPASLPLTEWISSIPDSVYITELSIPGTHDSGTFNFTGFGSSYVICQKRTFNETLNLGCRAFDIRLAPYSDTELKIVHSSFNTGLKFTSSFLTDVKNFLASRPREFIIARVKRDDGSADTVMSTLDTILNQAEWKDLIYVPASTASWPKLSDVRGKLILYYDGGIYDSRSKGYWLDYDSDTSAQLTYYSGTPSLLWYVHDNYEATDSNMKISHASTFLDNLVKLSYPESTLLPALYLNASHLLMTPPDYAIQVNPYMCGKIAETTPSSRVGLVYTDFYGIDLVFRCIQGYCYYDMIADDRYNGLPYVVIARNWYKQNLIVAP